MVHTTQKYNPFYVAPYYCRRCIFQKYTCLDIKELIISKTAKKEHLFIQPRKKSSAYANMVSQKQSSFMRTIFATWQTNIANI